MFDIDDKTIGTYLVDWPEMINGISYSGAYLIFHSKTKKTYVGHTTCLYSRKHQHLSRLKSNTHSNKELQKAYNDNDEISFHVIKITANEEEAIELEQSYLDIFFKLGILFNKEPNARSALGVKKSEETKEHLRQKSIEQWSNLELRKKQSENTKRYLLLPENKEKQRQAILATITTEEYRNSQREKANNQWSDPVKRFKKSEEVKKYALINGKKILINNKVYSHITEASKKLNVSHVTILKRLRDTNNLNYVYL